MTNWNVASLFSSLKTSGTSGMNSFNFGDYAAIKNGSYRKLVKAHYALQKNNSDSKTNKKNTVQKTDTTEQAGLSKMKVQADELKSAATDFDNKDLWESKNSNKLISAVKKFATEYNDVVSQSANVNSKDVSMQTGFMKSLTSTMSKALSKIGVNVSEDGSLSVDEDVLKNANTKDVKSLLSGKYSYASQVADKASAISSAAARSAGTYTQNGAWSNTLSGMFDQWL